MGGGDRPLFCPKCSGPVSNRDKICPGCGAPIEDVSRTLTSGFTSLLADEDWERFSPGNIFANRYTIIEEIGHGGMGRVFKALDRSLGITVAIKIIRSEYASNPRVIELFKQETVLARSISSENVVRVHDLGEAEKTKYISMDFVEGQNLRDLLYASGSLTISTAVKFGQQICSGLAAAHKQGIIHRDLKPSNIMIDKTGRVRVMDFGLAKTIDREEAGGVRAIVGTPEYLSPEQARGEKLDHRTDIYALGLILYEMVTGRPVFEAESLTGYIQQHCEVDPKPPSRWNHLIPAALESIILKCLKKERAERFQKVEDVCQALDRVVSPEAHRPKTARYRLLRYAAGAAACALLGFIVYELFFRPEPAVRSILKSVAVMRFDNATGDPSQDNWRNGLQHLLVMDLGQSKFLRVVSPEKLLQCLRDLGAEHAEAYDQKDLDRVAVMENVDYFLLGTYMMLQGMYRIDVRIVDARKGETLGSKSYDSVVFDEIANTCDEISLWIKHKFGLSPSDLKKDFDKELKKYTTRSFEALICFFRGLDFYQKSDHEQSSEFFRKAVAIDKNFALAYARLAMNLTYMGRFDEAKDCMLKAMSLRKNLTPRERLLIEGDNYNLLECDYPKAIETYAALLRIYPDDESALEHQGAVYRNTEEWNKAEECYERLQAINPQNRITIRNLAFIAEALGQYEKAAVIIQDNKGVFQKPEEFHSDLAFCFFFAGKIDRALLELEKALSFDPARPSAMRLLGHVHRMKGSYQAAEAAYGRFLESDRTVEERLQGFLWLGHLHLLQGQYKNCSKEIDDGLKLARKADLAYEELGLLLFKSHFLLLQKDYDGASETARRARQKAIETHYPEAEVEALHLIGRSEVGRGQLSEAKGTVQTMEQVITRIGFPKLLRECHYLEGVIAGARNSWNEAVSEFSKAVAMLPQQHIEEGDQALYLESLASALFHLGDLGSARAQYEKVIALTSDCLTAGDAYTRSLSQLGRICQEKNEPEKAKEYYQRYLNALAKADPGLKEVEEACKRLASIS